MPGTFQPSEPGCISVVFHFTLFGIPLAVIITVCLDSGTAPSLGDVTAVGNAADHWMQFDMMGVLATDLLYVQAVATDLSSETGPQATFNHGAGIAGSITGGTLPSQLACVVSLYTALRGRSYRGRSFIPGIPISYQATGANTVTSLGQSNLLSAYNALPARLVGAASHQAVLSRVSGGVRRTVAISNRVITRNTDASFDTQRRRGANAHRS